MNDTKDAPHINEGLVPRWEEVGEFIPYDIHIRLEFDDGNPMTTIRGLYDVWGDSVLGVLIDIMAALQCLGVLLKVPEPVIWLHGDQRQAAYTWLRQVKRYGADLITVH